MSTSSTNMILWFSNLAIWNLATWRFHIA